MEVVVFLLQLSEKEAPMNKWRQAWIRISAIQTTLATIQNRNNNLFLIILVCFGYLLTEANRNIIFYFESHFYYYAIECIKFLIISGLSLYFIHRRKCNKITFSLLSLFVFINFFTYFLNVMLLTGMVESTTTVVDHVKNSIFYPHVKYIRWSGTYNISNLYALIEYLMLLFGGFGLVHHYSNIALGWLNWSIHNIVSVYSNCIRAQK